jgi:hypothetical protein
MGNSADPAETRVSVVRFRASDNIEYEIDAPEIPLPPSSSCCWEPASPRSLRAAAERRERPAGAPV